MNQNFINCKVSGHDGKQISDICLNQICSFRVLTCDQCKVEQHSDHVKDIKSLNEINQEISQFENSYQKLLSIFRRLEYEIQQAIKQTNQLVATLIIPIENYRKSLSYETLSDLGIFMKTANLKDFITSVEKFQIILNGLYKLNTSEINTNEISIKSQLDNSETQSKELSTSGYELCAKGDFQKALKILEQALEVNSMNIEAIFYKAEALRNLEQYEKSIIEYDRCIKFDQEKLDYTFGKGEALRAMQRYDEAIQQFDKALTYNLKHFNSLFGKADSLRMIGMLEESLNFYNFALEINQRDFICLKFKAVLMEELGLDDFLNVYKLAAQIDPTDEYIQIKLSFYQN